MTSMVGNKGIKSEAKHFVHFTRHTLLCSFLPKPVKSALRHNNQLPLILLSPFPYVDRSHVTDRDQTAQVLFGNSKSGIVFPVTEVHRFYFFHSSVFSASIDLYSK